MKNFLLFLVLVFSTNILFSQSVSSVSNDTVMYVRSNSVMIVYDKYSEPYSLSVYYKEDGMFEPVFSTCKMRYAISKIIEDNGSLPTILESNEVSRMYIFYSINHDLFLNNSNIDKTDYNRIVKYNNACTDYLR